MYTYSHFATLCDLPGVYPASFSSPSTPLLPYTTTNTTLPSSGHWTNTVQPHRLSVGNSRPHWRRWNSQTHRFIIVHISDYPARILFPTLWMAALSASSVKSSVWLEKFGWTPGQGLGKNLQGRSTIIHVTKKDDTLGVIINQSM